MEEETFEVRNKRKQEWFWLDDSYLNGYARILGPYISMVYIALCRYVDKNQKCYPKQSTIAEEIGISAPTVNEAIKVLEFFRIIKKVRIGKTATNRYYLLDKRNWRKDFEVILNSLKSPDFKLFKITTKTLLIQNLNSLKSNRKEDIKRRKTYNNMSDKSDEWNFNNYLKEMKSDKRRHIQVIALYWAYKEYKFNNKLQAEAALKREFRPARALIGYSDDRITETMDYLESETDIKWTLETVHKFIDEDLDNISPIKGRKNNNY